MSAQSDRLAKLEQQRQQIHDSIRREKLKLAGEERKKDTRRKILIGSIILNEIKNDSALQERIQKLLDAKLSRDDDRALFDLKPLPEKSNGA